MSESVNKSEPFDSEVADIPSSQAENGSEESSNSTDNSAYNSEICCGPHELPESPRVQWCSEKDIHGVSDDRDVQLDYLREILMEEQPFRKMMHKDNEQYRLPTYGEITLSDDYWKENYTVDEVTGAPMSRHWSPDATSEQLLHGTAKDLATLGSILAVRTIYATGFQSDAEATKRFLELSNGLRNVTYVLRETRSRRGRPTTSAIQCNQPKRRRKLKSPDDSN